jgi:hypothetical protein
LHKYRKAAAAVLQNYITGQFPWLMIKRRPEIAQQINTVFKYEFANQFLVPPLRYTFLYSESYVEVVEPGSSVSIVSDYGLDDRAIGIRSPAGAKDFSSNFCVQTGCEAYPASCTTGQSAAGA